MRRAGSSSSILRPRGSLSRMGSQGDPLSVTILNTEQLPTYSVERFYMLSELHEHAHSILFLGEDDDNETQETEETTSTIQPPPREESSSAVSPPMFVILYLLWDVPYSANQFATQVIPQQLARLQDRILDMATSKTSTSNVPKDEVPTATSYEPSCRDQSNQKKDEDESTRSSLTVYLVVDRVVVPPPIQEEDAGDIRMSLDERFYQVQVDLAQELARSVASQTQLRLALDGITVGVANHERAAPGLEACMDAVHVGTRDRRPHRKRSSIALMTTSPDDLLGQQRQDVTDAAQGVLQCRVVAEWNGMGTLQTLAKRAHAQWRVQHNMPREEPKDGMKRRGVRRRHRLQGRPPHPLGLLDLCSIVLTMIFWVLVVTFLRDHFPLVWKECIDWLMGGGFLNE